MKRILKQNIQRLSCCLSISFQPKDISLQITQRLTLGAREQARRRGGLGGSDKPPLKLDNNKRTPFEANEPPSPLKFSFLKKTSSVRKNSVLKILFSKKSPQFRKKFFSKKKRTPSGKPKLRAWRVSQLLENYFESLPLLSLLFTQRCSQSYMGRWVGGGVDPHGPFWTQP